jgi:hypothetical protein
MFVRDLIDNSILKVWSDDREVGHGIAALPFLAELDRQRNREECVWLSDLVYLLENEFEFVADDLVDVENDKYIYRKP